MYAVLYEQFPGVVSAVLKITLFATVLGIIWSHLVKVNAPVVLLRISSYHTVCCFDFRGEGVGQ